MNDLVTGDARPDPAMPCLMAIPPPISENSLLCDCICDNVITWFIVKFVAPETPGYATDAPMTAAVASEAEGMDPSCRERAGKTAPRLAMSVATICTPC